MVGLTEVSQSNEFLDVKQDLIDFNDVTLDDGLNTLQDSIKDFWSESLPMPESTLRDAKKIYADLYNSIKNPNQTNLNLINRINNWIGKLR